MDSRKIAKIPKQHGWKHVRTTGDHVIFKHEDIDQIIALPHPRQELQKDLYKVS